jgi:alpha-beta hydrolase superfamily lysophospholipase
MNRVEFKTADGIEIIGSFRTPATPTHAAILLHMMPATKESWDAFAEQLEWVGFASIAIDERGHGESTMNGTLDYQTFGEHQQQAKIEDVRAAFKFLEQEGFAESQIVLIGASIGANLAIQFMLEHPLITTAIALSPGLNYRGVRTDEFIQQLHKGQRVILVASDDDDRDSAQSCRTLHALNPAQTELIEKQGLGHGTTMFTKEPTLMTELVQQFL